MQGYQHLVTADDLNQILGSLKAKKAQIAVVVDVCGETSGFVSHHL